MVARTWGAVTTRQPAPTGPRKFRVAAERVRRFRRHLGNPCLGGTQEAVHGPGTKGTIPATTYPTWLFTTSAPLPLLRCQPVTTILHYLYQLFLVAVVCGRCTINTYL